MPYSEELAERVRAELAGFGRVKLTERAMFGGVAFMVNGNMACGVNGDDLIVRFDPTLHQDVLTRPNARDFDFTGRSARGIVAVGPGPAVDDGELALWVRLGVTWAQSLPPKVKKAAKKKKAAPKKAAKKAKKATKKAKKATKKRR